MAKRRRAAFNRAHGLLDELKVLHRQLQDSVYASPSQVQPLILLQKLLIKEILRTERKIRRSKAILRTLDTEADPVAISALKERIEEYRHLAYNWRCFGDAIAFLFMDKFALKQTFFNTHNLDPKQDAGFLGGKEGLQNEWGLIDEFFALGIPALLTDLTNTIRHGDVCVMIGPDPFLIEVKSGKLDRRGKRQLNSIRQLMEFYKNDEAEELRGLKNIQRISSQTDEVVHVNAMNECISSAMKSGVSSCSPEEGLHYLAIMDDRINIANVISEMNLKQPMLFVLNEAKASRSWSPYYPYTLSIQNSDALYRFIWGDMLLAVLFEPAALQHLAEGNGVEFELQPQDSDQAFTLTRPGVAGPASTSKQFFYRLAFEFTSPAWLLLFSIEIFDRYGVAVDDNSTLSDTIERRAEVR